MNQNVSIITLMSYISDMYRFTREIDRYMKMNDSLPKIKDFDISFADTYLKGNHRRLKKIATTAMSSKYELITIEKYSDYYSLGLKGYDLVKGVTYFRPWLILLYINELKTALTVILSLCALIISLLVAVFK